MATHRLIAPLLACALLVTSCSAGTEDATTGTTAVPLFGCAAYIQEIVDRNHEIAGITHDTSNAIEELQQNLITPRGMVDEFENGAARLRAVDNSIGELGSPPEEVSTIMADYRRGIQALADFYEVVVQGVETGNESMIDARQDDFFDGLRLFTDAAFALASTDCS